MFSMVTHLLSSNNVHIYSCAQTQPQQKGSGDIWLIPRALFTWTAFCQFWWEIFNHRSHYKKAPSVVTTPESLDFFSIMTQYFFGDGSYYACSNTWFFNEAMGIGRVSPNLLLSCRWHLGTRLPRGALYELFTFQWLLSWLLHKWREGYLLPTSA